MNEWMNEWMTEWLNKWQINGSNTNVWGVLFDLDRSHIANISKMTVFDDFFRKSFFGGPISFFGDPRRPAIRGSSCSSRLVSSINNLISRLWQAGFATRNRKGSCHPQMAFAKKPKIVIKPTFWGPIRVLRTCPRSVFRAGSIEIDPGSPIYQKWMFLMIFRIFQFFQNSKPPF